GPFHSVVRGPRRVAARRGSRCLWADVRVHVLQYSIAFLWAGVHPGLSTIATASAPVRPPPVITSGDTVSTPYCQIPDTTKAPPRRTGPRTGLGSAADQRVGVGEDATVVERHRRVERGLDVDPVGRGGVVAGLDGHVSGDDGGVGGGGDR